jgi:hypothetical protein
VAIALQIMFAPIALTEFAMNLLVCRDQQRAVFAADLAAARLAGSLSTLRMLKKQNYRRIVALALHRFQRQEPTAEKVFEVIHTAIAETPQREFLRMDHIAQMEAPRIDSRTPRLIASPCRGSVYGKARYHQR